MNWHKILPRRKDDSGSGVAATVSQLSFFFSEEKHVLGITLSAVN